MNYSLTVDLSVSCHCALFNKFAMNAVQATNWIKRNSKVTGGDVTVSLGCSRVKVCYIYNWDDTEEQDVWLGGVGVGDDGRVALQRRNSSKTASSVVTFQTYNDYYDV